jgi:hypothetical protein
MDAEEAKELMALPGAKERLELTQADLMDYGSLAEVFMGCYGVFHTASPSDLVSNYPVNPQTHHLNSLLCYFSADFIDLGRWVLIGQVFLLSAKWNFFLELETLDSTSFQLQLRSTVLNFSLC